MTTTWALPEFAILPTLPNRKTSMEIENMSTARPTGDAINAAQAQLMTQGVDIAGGGNEQHS